MTILEQSDRALLELAAKAAGFEWKWSDNGDWIIRPRGVGLGRRAGDWEIWNPLTDDGDALRLAVKLHIDIYLRGLRIAQAVGSPPSKVYADELRGDDPDAATRRAIVRAAASLATTQPRSDEQSK